MEVSAEFDFVRRPLPLWISPEGTAFSQNIQLNRGNQSAQILICNLQREREPGDQNMVRCYPVDTSEKCK